MPRTVLTKTVAPGSYPTAGVTVTFGAADTSNNNRFLMTGDDVLVVRARGGGGDFTLTSVANGLGRSGTITETLADGDYKVYGPMKELPGWRQSDGYCYCAGSAAEIEIAVIKVPRP